jgi:acyl-CoA hydrolase
MRQSNQQVGQKNSSERFPRISAGSRIFVHGQSAVPYRLLDEVVRRAAGAEEIEFIHLHLEGTPAHIKPEYRSIFRINNLFVSPSLRNSVDCDRIDYTPIFLSEIPKLFKSGQCPIDVALIHVSPPDRFGYCTLGIGVDIARAAVDCAKIVIAQINPEMPRVHGDGLVHMSEIDYFIEVSASIPTTTPRSDGQSQELASIGAYAASLIENGSTLQVGIGAIPDAVLKSLRDHKHLGVHSEMFSDGVIDLIEGGAIDNSRKVIHPGKTVASFIQGSQKVYDFVRDNASIELYPSDYVNSPLVIARNPKVVAINSAVEIDLTGQVCSDSVGHRMVSGVGGQIDFIRGAAMSSAGKPIIAITSRTKSGASRIVSALHEGAGVVTTRSDVHFVITEYGIADLYGKTLGERARVLISIAHPADRDRLQAEWRSVCRQGK